MEGLTKPEKMMQGEAIILQLKFPVSVQDMGRQGVSGLGIPRSGVMDRTASSHINQVLANDAGAAVLEFAIGGPEILFTADTYIAISRGGFSPALNGVPVPEGEPVAVKNGNRLSFGRGAFSRWGYIAVQGGFLTAERFGSRSYCRLLGMTSLTEGSLLPFSQSGIDEFPVVPLKTSIDSPKAPFFSVMKGPEFDWLSGNNRRKLFSGHFILSSQSDRMAYRLKGLRIKHPQNFSMLSSGVFPGVVQMVPGNELMVLMRDAQLTGGYPRVLVMPSRELDRFAQLQPGSMVKFVLQFEKADPLK